MYMASPGCLADVEKMILHAKLGCKEYQWNTQPYTFCSSVQELDLLKSTQMSPSTILRVSLLPDQHPIFHIGGPARL